MDNTILLDFENSFNVIKEIKNTLRSNLYMKNSTIYFISNNKIKKGIIIEIKHNKFYICRFKYFPFLKKEMVPGIDCFATKNLAKFVLNLQQKSNL